MNRIARAYCLEPLQFPCLVFRGCFVQDVLVINAEVRNDDVRIDLCETRRERRSDRNQPQQAMLVESEQFGGPCAAEL